MLFSGFKEGNGGVSKVRGYLALIFQPFTSFLHFHLKLAKLQDLNRSYSVHSRVFVLRPILGDSLSFPNGALQLKNEIVALESIVWGI